MAELAQFVLHTEKKTHCWKRRKMLGTSIFFFSNNALKLLFFPVSSKAGFVWKRVNINVNRGCQHRSANSIPDKNAISRFHSQDTVGLLSIRH